MPTNPTLGEFVEKDGQLYFIKADNLPAGLDKTMPLGVPGQPGRCSGARYAYLLGSGVAVVLGILALCAIILFPVPMFALLIGMGVLKL